ncbi:hypothetical protein B7463_g6944, partial [Scytalidium lignicola]
MAVQSTLVNGTGLEIRNKTTKKDVDITSSLEELQTDEQRRILDTVAQVRKCGLESILSLPQLVVCGDQSAGKSSVLEALTEIPFPRHDNLCTRFATEIILRRGPYNSLTIKIIPDNQRPPDEQMKIKSFEQSITDFDELPRIMELATDVMGMGEDPESDTQLGAFARDVLSIEIEGPTRPQLTLVDIPGLIANATKGVTDADVKMVAEITDHYISQPRTICLAVISATNDHANQPILTKVRKHDPNGDRTLGIITKPDRLPAGSGSEKAFISLAQNEDVFFKLGWHVLKNRSFEEGNSSLMERNMAEKTFFRTSNFKTLQPDSVGIDALRARLSMLLFDHVKRELPKLRQDLENALAETKHELSIMGSRRSTAAECKAYLSQLSLDIYEISKAAAEGNYEGEYFQASTAHEGFKDAPPISISRIRAVVQKLNTEFSKDFREVAHKYHIIEDSMKPFDSKSDGFSNDSTALGPQIQITKDDALKWVARVMERSRGRELIGNYNPLIVGELFWEQSSRWQELASKHIEVVSSKCCQFWEALLCEKCPKDVKSRLWDSKISDALKARSDNANEELTKIMEDAMTYPTNYNHYYTDIISRSRKERQEDEVAGALDQASETTPTSGMDPSSPVTITVKKEQVMKLWRDHHEQNMENFSCEEALDCVLAIYKVLMKIFIANIPTQVVERHLLRGFQKIFSPVIVNAMSDKEVEAIASEPLLAKRQREFLEDRVRKLEDGHKIFRGVMGSG